MNLLDSLLDAIVRLNGDALVMHVGEKPYVVTTSEAKSEFRGPIAWGQVELSSRVLTPEAVGGMLGQILSLDHRAALDEYGATEFEVTAANDASERFTIVAARGGDDIWLEVRRQSKQQKPVAAVAAAPSEAAPASPEPAAEPARQVEASEQYEAVGAPVAVAERAVSGERGAEETAAIPEPAPVEAAAAVEEPAEEPVPLDERVHVTPTVEAAAHEFEAGAAPEAEPEILAVDRPVAGGVEPTGVAHGEAASVHGLGDEPREEHGVPLPAHATAHAAAELPYEEPAVEEIVEMEDEAPDTLDLPPEVEQEISAAAEEWGEDVMTEGDLGELLRASAAAVITGETEAAPQNVDSDEAHRAQPHESPGAEPLSTYGVGDASQLSAEEAVKAAREAFRAAEQTLPHGDEAAAHEAAGAFAIAPADRPLDAAAPQEESAVAAPGQPSPDEAQPSRPAAVVLPLTRQPRTEKEAETRTTVSATLHRLLRLAAARGAASIHLSAGAVPIVRVDGDFSPLDGEPAMTAASIERVLAELAPRTRDAAAPSAEWLMDVPEMGRVRCVAFRDHRGPGLILRIVPARAISADQLGLSAEVQALCSEADGLVIVTGSRGSGRSTLLTSFVDLINRTRSDHIITVEPQIQFIHETKRSLVSQREIRGDADALAVAVRAAIREEPDVLVIEDARTPELVSMALEAAESGRLVFFSMTGASTVSTIERMIELFPAERREKVQASLAHSLRGVISQVLLRKLRGGRVAAREVLLNTPAVASLILEGKTFQLPAALDAGRRYGMVPLAESLAALVREGVVHPSHAHRKAPNREQLLAILRRDGVDTSAAERLA